MRWWGEGEGEREREREPCPMASLQHSQMLFRSGELIAAAVQRLQLHMPPHHTVDHSDHEISSVNKAST